jgi:hypothetical protein
MEKVSVNQEALGFVSDRATVAIRAHYQEFEPNTAVSAYHAFDYSNPQSESPFQTTMRVSPASKKQINIGELQWGKVMLVLCNEPIRTNAQLSPQLHEASLSNTISFTNADGIEVARLRPRHACVIEFPFPVFVQSATATALLSVTAYPVITE